MNYTYANGRRYHAFRAGAYVLPNDEAEQDRLDLLHHIWRLMIGGKLLRAPLPEDPQSILDFGTGTGIWAIDFAGTLLFLHIYKPSSSLANHPLRLH